MTTATLSRAAPRREQAAPGAGPLLRVEGISLSFGGVQALADVGFEVWPGEICGLIGPNGAGKSSLINVLSGVYRPDAGSLTFAGVRRAALAPGQVARDGIGRTFQNLALFRGMTVRENVLAGLAVSAGAGFLEHALRLPRARREERRHRAEAERVLGFLGLEDAAEALVRTLPYGVQKRVELARALVARPRLLLLDEPMAGMTAGEKVELSALVARTRAELGITVVLIEHDLGVVMNLSEHVVVLDSGRKIADGTPAEIRADPAVIRAYLGEAA